MKKADRPFQFATVSYLTRICNQSANNLAELRVGLETCTDASIFYHTFQSLGRHHFLTEGFSNDFAQWVLAALNRTNLAEQLATLDIRGYTDLRDLRNDMLKALDDFCAAHPHELERPAFEPFYFCESLEVMLPLTFEAATLEEFRNGLEHMSHGAFYYHFLVSRLRLQLRTNDFSQWFANELGLESLARRTDHIDVYTHTLEDARAKLIQYVDRELAA
jgi:hypothetical protein